QCGPQAFALLSTKHLEQKLGRKCPVAAGGTNVKSRQQHEVAAGLIPVNLELEVAEVPAATVTEEAPEKSTCLVTESLAGSGNLFSGTGYGFAQAIGHRTEL